MAKVMISLPGELLAQLDEHARRRGKSRSGLLRELAERELRNDTESRGREIATLLARAAPHGGGNAGHVRDDRRQR